MPAARDEMDLRLGYLRSLAHGWYSDLGGDDPGEPVTIAAMATTSILVHGIREAGYPVPSIMATPDGGASVGWTSASRYTDVTVYPDGTMHLFDLEGPNGEPRSQETADVPAALEFFAGCSLGQSG